MGGYHEPARCEMIIGDMPRRNIGKSAHGFYPRSGLFFSGNPGVLVALSGNDE
jgi:hypothetical protein